MICENRKSKTEKMLEIWRFLKRNNIKAQYTEFSIETERCLLVCFSARIAKIILRVVPGDRAVFDTRNRRHLSGETTVSEWLKDHKIKPYNPRYNAGRRGHSKTYSTVNLPARTNPEDVTSIILLHDSNGKRATMVARKRYERGEG